MKMKKILLAIIISFWAGGDIIAQKLYPMTVGLSTNTRSGLNISQLPNGRKLEFYISPIPDLSASIYLPYSADYNLGTIFHVSYQNVGHSIKDEVSTNIYSANISYASLSSSIFIEGFIVGLELGLPVASNIDGDFDTDNLSPVAYTIKLGKMFSISESEKGRLTFDIFANFMLNPIYRNFPKSDPLAKLTTNLPAFPVSKQHNPRIFSLSLGLTYFFNINY